MRSFPLLQVVPTRPMEAAPGRWLQDREQHRTVFGSYEDGRASTSSKSTKTMCSDRGRLRGGMDSSLQLEEATQARHLVATNAGRSGSGTQESGAPMRADSSTNDESYARAPVASRSSSRVGAAWDQDRQCNCVGVQATRQLRQRGMVAVMPMRPFKSGGCRARGG